MSAYHIEGEDRPGRWLVTCDHATNRVPDWVNGGDLGLPVADMERHIAFDIGAKGVALGLGAALDSPVITSDFSRLVIDPNRGADDPTLVMQLYDGSIIPGNRHVGPAEVAERTERLYRPYHDAYAKLLEARPDAVICSVHSFTPQLKGQPPRPWEVGVLYADQDIRLALPLLHACRAEGWCVGENEPYGGHLPGDALDQHALATGRLHVLLEVRNDLIADAEGQALWVSRLAPILQRVLKESGL